MSIYRALGKRSGLDFEISFIFALTQGIASSAKSFQPR
jgi:hypothetical protein